MKIALSLRRKGRPRKGRGETDRFPEKHCTPSRLVHAPTIRTSAIQIGRDFLFAPPPHNDDFKVLHAAIAGRPRPPDTPPLPFRR